MSERRFNVRVYGILFNTKGELLISDERRHGQSFTKFPGGGLEWGEGLIECLKREFLEELNIKVDVRTLFYCTDFFQQSAFRVEDQLISIYYKVDFSGKDQLKFANYKLPLSENTEQFRWIDRNKLSASVFTYPIDQHVGKLLKEELK